MRGTPPIGGSFPTSFFADLAHLQCGIIPLICLYVFSYICATPYTQHRYWVS